ncbi:MAG: type II toxin-antitoxin system VapC family toxin [Bacteroidota bacterium]|nr:type II toxin-antitoxin system VapC family toxin [Bacteroidota bacterium]
MKYLLDTHTLIWLLDEPEKLSAKAYSTILDINNTCSVSIASLWEMVIKAGLNKLELRVSFSELREQLAVHEIQIFPIYFIHLPTYLGLPLLHKDPFDRMIIAQALAHNFTIITKDLHFPPYNVPVLW